MSPDRQQAINYLRAPAQGLWRWAENGEVLVWRDGTTVAFREEIQHILEWLAPNGLPAFGAVAFLLAACRGKVPEVADIIQDSNAKLPSAMGAEAELLITAREQLKAQLGEALNQLALVSRLPAELITGLKPKCVLAEAVFESAKVERQVDAAVVLSGLREPMTDQELCDEGVVDLRGRVIRQIHILAEGLKPHTPESLALRLRTGLDALPKEVAVDLPNVERARRLIDELSHDREYGAVARAAKELMAAVRLPRRLDQRDLLAVGGVADITNRGPLDRLLLSELAHDDLTLSVRVALNEALYLRREPPMREPPGTLALLLDSGVRLWGVPRVLAAAVALALVARDRQHSEILAWRAEGPRLEPVDLLSLKGLTQHLGALDTTAHSGKALPAFVQAVPPGAQNQSVLITHRDTLEDPEFRRALAESTSAPGFVAAVDREGRFELHALPLSRKAPVCEADLDLVSLFGEPVGVFPIREDVGPDLPAIFGLAPFPFLLPAVGKVDCWVKGDDGMIYAVLSERRLIQCRGPGVGARTLASDLPAGKTIWMDYAQGSVHVIKGGSTERPARLISLTPPCGRVRRTDLATGSEVLAVHRYGDTVLLIRRQDVRAHSLSDGRLVGKAVLPHSWMNGRYVRGSNHFHFVVWDGERARFKPVTFPENCPVDNVVGVFDRQGLEGPWVLTTDLALFSTATGEEIQLYGPTGYPAKDYALTTSRDGHRIHLRWPPGQPACDMLYDLATSVRTNNPELRSPSAVLDRPPPLPTWNLFHLVECVAQLPDGLALCGRKGRWRKLGLKRDGKMALEDLPSRPSEPLCSIAFDLQAKPTRHGCTLRVASWPCGSKAFLDSRGLLHLKSHDSAVPEMSIVLSSNEVAGWTADGFTCGPAFFFDGIQNSEPSRVFERLKQFLAHL